MVKLASLLRLLLVIIIYSFSYRFAAAQSFDNVGTGTFSGTNTGSATITTYNNNDVVIVDVASEATNSPSATVSSISGGGLTWTSRASQQFNDTDCVSSRPCWAGFDRYWAVAATPLTNATISITLSKNIDDASIIVYAVRDTTTPSSPFDVASPQIEIRPASTACASGTISSISSHGIVFSNLAAVSNYTAVATVGGNALGGIDSVTNSGGVNWSWQTLGALIYSSQLSSATTSWPANGDGAAVCVIDAIAGTTQSSTTPPLGTNGCALDGFAGGGGTGAATTFTTQALTTTKANDVIVLMETNNLESGSFGHISSVSGGGLSWAKRASYEVPFVNCDGHGTCFDSVEEWWATAASPLTSQQFTLNMDATWQANGGFTHAHVFGVSGTVTPSSPWDPNIALPATERNATLLGTNIQVPGVSATGPADFLLGFCSNGGQLGCQSTHTPWSTITTASSAQPFIGLALSSISIYEPTAAPISNMVVDLKIGTGEAWWRAFIDALVCPGGASSTLLFHNPW